MRKECGSTSCRQACLSLEKPPSAYLWYCVSASSAQDGMCACEAQVRGMAGVGDHARITHALKVSPFTAASSLCGIPSSCALLDRDGGGLNNAGADA